MDIPEPVVNFLERQGFVLVSTVDIDGVIHCSAKGIAHINKSGKLIVVDLYLQQTYKNLLADPRISITAVEEHAFHGYTLQGRAKIVPREEIPAEVIESWENKIVRRMSQRVVKGVQRKAKSRAHFEAGLPPLPQYLIEMTVDNILDLSPPALRKNHHE